MWIQLREPDMMRCYRLSFVIEDDEASARGALIDCPDELLHCV